MVREKKCKATVMKCRSERRKKEGKRGRGRKHNIPVSLARRIAKGRRKSRGKKKEGVEACGQLKMGFELQSEEGGEGVRKKKEREKEIRIRIKYLARGKGRGKLKG